MICKVVSALLGYNERLYKKDEDIEVSTQAEVKRLTGFGVIEASAAGVPQKKEAVKTADSPKTFFDSKTTKERGKRK